jgi:hypothetical protein
LLASPNYAYLGPERSRDERNMMGPQNFRTLATNELSKQTAPQRTPARLPGRQVAQFVGDQRLELVGGVRVAVLMADRMRVTSDIDCESTARE